MNENPYEAPAVAELVKPKRQFPPLGYMFIAAFFLQGTVSCAWFVIPGAITENQWGLVSVLSGMCAVSFLFTAMALRPVWRWFSTGRYH